ncbi:hypothetical protein ACN1NW_000416 [Acinetobacter baumannii]|nr:hypothetical protein [Acinetobacter baumannii]ELA7031005.1 hypothetical protein [Acinetobacter baumannii]ELA7118768.1 hypothetical protein [Acinetobacter baumannii]ELB0919717.1 hypothetical protein [Acinetobacter baumannii]ELB0965893.1 hypothetical protein [Acinetobacter baumannii]
MKVTAHRIAPMGYDALIIGFDRPCIISLCKQTVSPLCGAGLENDTSVFRYASHSKEDELNPNLSAKDYAYVDGLGFSDHYCYYSTINLSHLTHEQHKIMFTAVAEINDVTDFCSFPLRAEEDKENIEDCRKLMKRTDNMVINLKKLHIKYSDGEKATYDDLHN